MTPKALITLSVSLALVTSSVPATAQGPIKIGDTIHVEGEVTSKAAFDPEHGLVETRWRVMNQRGKLVLRVTVELVWKRSSTMPPVEEPRTDAQPVLI